MNLNAALRMAKVGDKIRRSAWIGSYHLTVGKDGCLLVNNSSDPVKIREKQVNIDDVLAEDWVVMPVGDVKTIDDRRPFLVKSCNNRMVVVDGVVYERKVADFDEKEDIHYLDANKLTA